MAATKKVVKNAFDVYCQAAPSGKLSYKFPESQSGVIEYLIVENA